MFKLVAHICLRLQSFGVGGQYWENALGEDKHDLKEEDEEDGWGIS